MLFLFIGIRLPLIVGLCIFNRNYQSGLIPTVCVMFLIWMFLFIPSSSILQFVIIPPTELMLQNTKIKHSLVCNSSVMARQGVVF